MAGLSDINLFAGSSRLPPNILIILDSSASMLNAPSGNPGGASKKDIARKAIIQLISGINPVDGGEINACHSEERTGQVEVGLVLSTLGASARRWGRTRVAVLGWESSVEGLDLEITGLDQLIVEVVLLQCLTEHEEGLGFVMPIERLGDVGFGAGTAWLPEGGQHVRVSLTSDDGADDGHASDTCDVADDQGQSEVH